MKSFRKSCGQSFSFKQRKPVHSLKKAKSKSVLLKKGQIVDNEIAELQQKIDAGIDPESVETFSDFPLSKNTLAGLDKAKYSKPTEIQKQAICAALQGKDVLGAAKTGSGKTLAFLIPVLEMLYKTKTSPTFGMAALIITPTRELAFQIFEVLNKVRVQHDFSANLVIGGKHMWREENLMCNTNIVICTPGRLLHHLDQTRMFSADELKILVLDEADRIMDSKFAKDMDAIINHLPEERQTLLFSATQTKSVKALARLSLKNPSYVSVHEHAQYSTPSGLKQSYIVCEIQHKLSFLYSFIKNHPNTKILVFLHTCKQVRLVHAIMKRERPGMTVLHLHGGLNQLRRVDTYQEFCRRTHALLIATDIACRGLDFPGVNWVVQLDCPMDAATYIHRAGRTARFERNGQALLVLLPSEEEHMVQELRTKKIPIDKIKVNNKFQRDITGSIAAACAENSELKDMAERAFRNYMFSLTKLKNKNIFDVNKIDCEQFAKSLGLFKPPRLRFLEKMEKAKTQKLEDQTVDDDTELFTVKQGPSVEEDETADTTEEDMPAEDADSSKPRKKALTKAALAKRLAKKGISANKHITFNEEGNVVRDAHKHRLTEDVSDEENEGGINIGSAAKRLRLEDRVDKGLERERVKQKHREERIKKKEKKRAETAQQRRAAECEEEEEAVLSGVDDDDDPFRYIPDPDQLASREKDDSGSDESESESGADDRSDDDDNNSADSNDDDDNNSADSSDDDGSEYQENRSSLEDAALRLLQANSKKKK